jgi:anti-sigma B factor antagonist
VEMSKILVARGANLGFVKVVGRGSFQNSGCLKAFYQQLLKEGTHRFVVDLDACTYLDSTFLGILLSLALALKQGEYGPLHVLNAGPKNLDLLKNLGLDRLIHISSGGAGGAGGAGSSAPKGSGDPVGNGHGGKATQKVSLEGITEAGLEEMPCPVPTREEAAPTILEAHEALMEFDERNVPKFKDVVEFLREDLGHTATKN